MDAGGAFAAYITGNVASNLIGRLVSAAVVDTPRPGRRISISSRCSISPAPCWSTSPFARQADAGRARDAIAVRGDDRAIGAIRRCARPSRIGFCILFAFIGTFTFVNFVLVRAPLSLGRMELGLVYFVFRAFRRHDTVCRQGRGTIRHPAGDMGRARGRRDRPAADAVVAAAAGADRHGAGRRRHLLRAGRPPPALSARPRTTTAASPAAPISPATSSAAWSAAPCSDNCSTALAGRPASPASARRWRWRRG